MIVREPRALPLLDVSQDNVLTGALFRAARP
jgi:hypothetical protein